ncbi:MAG: GNAT family N-acetyltransferase [Deltaproteobacteria bacterium]|nr:GNAT family N-acetyltransferase [Deltaproteobacteria bacterium]
MGEDLFAAACPDWRKEKARQVRAACDPAHPALVCVAEKEGQVVGFITFHANDASRIGEIGNNAVRPDFQSAGIGTRMYEHVFERLRRLGMRFVKVGTGGDPAHAPARRAYEKAGFSIQLPSVTYYRAL